MKVTLIQKDDFIGDIRYNGDYMVLSKIHKIEIWNKENLTFSEKTDSESPVILSTTRKVGVKDIFQIKIIDYILNRIVVYSSEIISSAPFRQIYQDNKLLLSHGKDVFTSIAPLTLCILENGIVQKQWETLPMPINQLNVKAENGYIFVPNYELNLISVLDDRDGSLLWHFNISQLGPYYDNSRLDIPPQECKRKIDKIYYHNDKVVVTLSRGIVALHPQTGELLWKLLFDNRYTDNLIFDENIIYSGCGFCYTVIDIEQGKVLYTNDQQPKEIVNIGGKDILRKWVSYRSFCLRNRFIWSYLLYDGCWYLLKLEPATGKVVDSCALPIGLSQDPIFIENTIYMRDMDGFLNIFELEE